MYLGVIILLLSLLGAFLTSAEEPQGPPLPPPADHYPLSSHDLWQWRALDAEIKVIRLEMQEAIQQRIEEKKRLEKRWQKVFGIKDLGGWVVDIEQREIRREK